MGRTVWPYRTAKWPRKSIDGPSPEKIFSSLSSLPSEPVDLCLLVCAAFFRMGLQPRGCTKQLIRVKADQPFAWARRLQTHWSAPSKIMRSPRRLFKATRSRSQERSEFDASSTRGQPRGKVLGVRFSGFKKPSRTGVQSKRRGREQWRMGASRDQRPQRAVSRSTLGRARPWRASVRRCGSPVRSAKLPYGAGIGRFSSGDRFSLPGQRWLVGFAWSSQGTG